MDKVFIVKDIIIEEVETKEPYYEVVAFENHKLPLETIDNFSSVKIKWETVDIHKFHLNNDLFRFGMTKDAEKKLPILSLMNILIDERDFLNQQIKNQNYKVADLTIRLADYKNSKIIRFLHFIKIL